MKNHFQCEIGNDNLGNHPEDQKILMKISTELTFTNSLFFDLNRNQLDSC